MATTLLAIENEQVKLRWEEEYVSEGLNEKMLGTIPGGIIRGGLLEPHPSANQTLRVKADPTYGDIVASYEDVNGRQMTVNLGSGDVDLDLSTLGGSTVYIAIYVSYSLLTETEAEWRAYTQAQLDGAPEKDRVIIWGSVDVPATAIPIPAADIYQESRREARWKQSSGLVPWVPIIRDGGFEGRISHWDYPSITGSLTWTVDEADYYRGNRSLNVNASIGTGTFTCTQPMMFPCDAGQLFYLRFMSKTSNWTGTLQLQARFYDKDGSYLSSQDLVETVSADTHDWEEHAGVFVAPASAVFVMPRIYITATSSGTECWMDDAQMFVQTDTPGNLQRPDTSMIRNDRLHKLVFGDSTTVPPLLSPNDFRFGKVAGGTFGIEFLGSGTGILNLDSSLYLQVQNDIMPDPTESQDLGSTSNRWEEIWGNRLYLFDTTDSPQIEFFAEDGVGSYTRNRWELVAGFGKLEFLGVADGGGASYPIMRLTYDSGIADEQVAIQRQLVLSSPDGLMPGADSYVPMGTTSIRWLSFFSDEVDTHVLKVSGGVSQGCQDLIPVSDDGYDLGTATYQWRDLRLDGTAYIDILSLSTVTSEGVGTHVYPTVSDTFDLGTAGRTWNQIYVAEVIIEDSLRPGWELYDTGGASDEKRVEMYQASNILNFDIIGDVSGSDRIFEVYRSGASLLNIRFGTDVLPRTTNAYGLGTSTYRWEDLYLGGNGADECQIDFKYGTISDGRWQIFVASDGNFFIDITDTSGVYQDHALWFVRSDTEVQRAVFSANARVEIRGDPSAGQGFCIIDSYTPTSSSEAGATAGTIVWDTSYLYVRTGSSTWKRITLTTF